MKKLLLLLSATVLICSCEDLFNPEGADGGKVTSITLNTDKLSFHKLGETATLTATVEPADADVKIKWESDMPDWASVKDGVVTAKGIGTVVIRAKAGKKEAACEVTIGPANTVVPEGAVDFDIVLVKDDGTIYKLYWAEYNLGASKPEEYGDYYAWGETETKSSYNWKTYKWSHGEIMVHLSDGHVDGDICKIFKYCPEDQTVYWDGEGNPDGKLVLDLEDDAARAKLKGNWRIPTREEWAALYRATEQEYTSRNSVNGLLMKGSTYFSDRSIFLPEGGDIQYDMHSYYNGAYWSSSLLRDTPNDAQLFFFNSAGDIMPHLGGRQIGYPIRPVSE